MTCISTRFLKYFVYTASGSDTCLIQMTLHIKTEIILNLESIHLFKLLKLSWERLNTSSVQVVGNLLVSNGAFVDKYLF